MEKVTPHLFRLLNQPEETNRMCQVMNENDEARNPVACSNHDLIM